MDQEIGVCNVCNAKGPVIRTYFYYDVKCRCCNGENDDHFEIVWTCEECKPVAPQKITVSMFAKNDDSEIDHIVDHELRAIRFDEKSFKCTNSSGVLWESIWRYENEKYFSITITPGYYGGWTQYEDEKAASISLKSVIETIRRVKEDDNWKP